MTEVTDKRNKEELLKMCYGRNGEKTKTKKLIEVIKADSYIRAPRMDILNKCRFRSKVQIMSMFRMLKCATNFKNNYQTENCSICLVPDNESHRINHCIRYKEINLCESSLKVDFDCIYSHDENAINCIIDAVCTLWDL